MFLDTFGLLCLLDRKEPFHQAAHEAYQTANRWLTHNYILSELVALATARGVERQDTLLYVADLMANVDVELVWVDEALNDQALALLNHRLDKTYSLCDAVSFVLMRDRKIIEALTNDRHFEQEGFVRLLKPIGKR